MVTTSQNQIKLPEEEQEFVLTASRELSLTPDEFIRRALQNLARLKTEWPESFNLLLQD